jgi:hypothetical protein
MRGIWPARVSEGCVHAQMLNACTWVLRAGASRAYARVFERVRAVSRVGSRVGVSRA